MANNIYLAALEAADILIDTSHYRVLLSSNVLVKVYVATCGTTHFSIIAIIIIIIS